MKNFLLDQFCFLIIGIGLMMLIPVFTGPIFTVILELMAVFSWGYLSKSILVFPVDLLAGPSTKEVYYYSKNNAKEYEFFKGAYCEWIFLDGENFFHLFVDANNTIPENNRTLKIKYYRFSKVLINWSYIE